MRSARPFRGGGLSLSVMAGHRQMVVQGSFKVPDRTRLTGPLAFDMGDLGERPVSPASFFGNKKTIPEIMTISGIELVREGGVEPPRPE